jgi:hypothetical protein
VFLWEPWHGPVVLSLSEGHGIDAGDLPALPLLALAVALIHARAGDALKQSAVSIGRLARAAPAVALGALLLLVGVDTTSHPPLVPAGGGTFDGHTQHADGPRADPVNRWSHLALTYDGARLRLFLDGTQVSSRTATGTIRMTTDPLWIGGNRPYGEYFRGVIDEVRVYDRALSPAKVRAEMSRPIPSDGIDHAVGLVAAYGFDAGSGRRAADASGKGNTGTISGATWTSRGRFGSAVRFDGAGQTVRVPASAALDLKDAMTLSGWVRPSESQAGWRTILHRQTDAYFLTAGGGTYPAEGAGTLDDMRVILMIIAALWLCVTLAGRHPPPVAGRRLWYWPPVVLFLVGSAVDAVLAPSVTLIGPALVAMWCALSAGRRSEAAIMYLLAAAFTAVSVGSVVGPGDIASTDDDGGIARSIALGWLLVTAGVLIALRRSRGREARADERI